MFFFFCPGPTAPVAPTVATHLMVFKFFLYTCRVHTMHCTKASSRGKYRCNSSPVGRPGTFAAGPWSTSTGCWRQHTACTACQRICSPWWRENGTCTCPKVNKHTRRFLTCGLEGGGWFESIVWNHVISINAYNWKSRTSLRAALNGKRSVVRLNALAGLFVYRWNTIVNIRSSFTQFI